jgi:hypothetical protein
LVFSLLVLTWRTLFPPWRRGILTLDFVGFLGNFVLFVFLRYSLQFLVALKRN